MQHPRSRTSHLGLRHRCLRGCPSVVLVARKRPLHQILLGLIVIYLTGNLLMASCSDLHLGVLFRFISGLPHGAYFGVGSIVADRLAPRGKSTSAIAIMCSGMTVANLIGIPAGTWLSDMVSWRVIFLFNGAWGILTSSCSTVWFREWNLFRTQG